MELLGRHMYVNLPPYKISPACLIRYDYETESKTFRTAAMSHLQKKNPLTENVFFSSVVGYFNFKILKLALMKRCWCRSNVGSSHDSHFGTIYGRT
jgi:hypothetical protein